VQKLLIASVVAVGFFGAPALAADLPIKDPAYSAPITAPPYNWSGYYVGANIGGAWTSGSLNIPGNNLYGGITEFIGGVQAGYNVQAGHLLFGVEARQTGNSGLSCRFCSR
jgi:opacity protein-like surface antigen